MLEALGWIAADREKRQRLRQLVPEPFNLQRRLEPASPAQGNGHVTEDGQAFLPSIRGGQAKAVEAVQHVDETALLRPSMLHYV